MTAPKPMTDWQAANLPEALPLHVRRNIDGGEGGCWLWNRSRSKDGYGWASLNDVTYQAHRLIYRLLVGEIEEGMVLDHLCRIRHCVNPAHLEQVTPGENIRRSELTTSGMKRCVRGHELAQLPTQRRCLVCRDAYVRSRASGEQWDSRRPWAGEDGPGAVVQIRTVRA